MRLNLFNLFNLNSKSNQPKLVAIKIIRYSRDDQQWVLYKSTSYTAGVLWRELACPIVIMGQPEVLGGFFNKIDVFNLRFQLMKSALTSIYMISTKS